MRSIFSYNMCVNCLRIIHPDNTLNYENRLIILCLVLWSKIYRTTLPWFYRFIIPLLKLQSTDLWQEKIHGQNGPRINPNEFFTCKRNLGNDMKLKVKTGVIFTDKNMSKGIIYGHALFFFREKKN